METRYTQLFVKHDNLYTEGAPICIAAYALLRDNQTGKLVAQIKMTNLSSQEIRAVKVSICAVDAFGTKINTIGEYQYTWLDVHRDEAFGHKNAVILPSPLVASFTCKCLGVVFQDGSTWNAPENAVWAPLAEPSELFKELGELSLQYKREIGEDAKFVPETDRDLWLCTCGAINRANEALCHKCNKSKEEMFSKLDVNALEEHHKLFLQQELEHKRKEEEEKQREAEAARKQRKKVWIWAISVIALILVVVGIYVVPQEIKYGAKYKDAVALAEKGEYGAAVAELEKMDGYWRAKTKVKELISKKGTFGREESARITKLVDEIESLMRQKRFEEASQKINEAKKLLGDYDIKEANSIRMRLKAIEKRLAESE